MKIYQLKDAAQGAALAANIFKKAANKATDCPVSVATEGTMVGVYRELAKSGFTPSRWGTHLR